MNPKTAIIVGIFLLVIGVIFALGISHSNAQTVIDWRTVVASITHSRTPQPLTPTTTMDIRYTWTPTVPFVVRTSVPRPRTTATPIDIRPIEYITVEVTRIFYVVVTATPFRPHEPEMIDPIIPIIIPTLEN